jgi:hypothetical protein
MLMLPILEQNLEDCFVVCSRVNIVQLYLERIV